MFDSAVRASSTAMAVPRFGANASAMSRKFDGRWQSQGERDADGRGRNEDQEPPLRITIADGCGGERTEAPTGRGNGVVHTEPTGEATVFELAGQHGLLERGERPGLDHFGGE